MLVLKIALWGGSRSIAPYSTDSGRGMEHEWTNQGDLLCSTESAVGQLTCCRGGTSRRRCVRPGNVEASSGLGPRGRLYRDRNRLSPHLAGIDGEITEVSEPGGGHSGDGIAWTVTRSGGVRALHAPRLCAACWRPFPLPAADRERRR